MSDPREGMDELLDELQQRQRNTLPPDLLRNDKQVDDVLWHGSDNGFGIQRAGAFIIGSNLVVIALVAGTMLAQKGARLFLLPVVVIAYGGLRIVYKSLVGRSKEGMKR